MRSEAKNRPPRKPAASEIRQAIILRTRTAASAERGKAVAMLSASAPRPAPRTCGVTVGQSGHQYSTQNRPRPNGNMSRLQRLFGKPGRAHGENAKSGGTGGETEQQGIVGKGQRLGQRGRYLIRRAQNKVGCENADNRGGKDRAGAGNGIGAENNFKSIESAGQRRTERAADRPRRAGRDQKPQIAATQT